MSARSLSWRRNKNRIATSLATAAALLGLFILAAVLWTLIGKGLAAISWSTFTQITPGPGDEGGLLNAIVGSLMLTSVGILIATPIGVLAGTFLAEYGAASPRLASTVRFINDVLLSAPSILIGLFVYEILVAPVGNYSGWAGSVALGVIAIPIIVRTTEDMLSLVPRGLREAAAGVGAPRWKVIMTVCYRAAATGIVTGILLSIARITGETAPLLFTALNNQFMSLDMSQPMANLPVTIFRFAMSPYEDWNTLAWGGALIITVSILALSAFTRIALGRPDRR